MGAAPCATLLRDRLGDDGFEALDEMITTRQANLLTVDRFEDRLTSALSELKAELRGEMHQLRADIRVDLADRITELTRWAIVFWVAQAAAVAGIVAALR